MQDKCHTVVKQVKGVLIKSCCFKETRIRERERERKHTAYELLTSVTTHNSKERYSVTQLQLLNYLSRIFTMLNISIHIG